MQPPCRAAAARTYAQGRGRGGGEPQGGEEGVDPQRAEAVRRGRRRERGDGLGRAHAAKEPRAGR